MQAFDKDVLTTGEVAKICHVAARTVSKWFDSGQLNGYRIPGSKDRRIPVSNLVQFMRSHGIPMDGLMSGQSRVLIADTDVAVSGALTDVLSSETDYEVRTCNSAFSLGIECERFRPHVLLLDLGMCGGDPAATVASIRANEDLQGMKIVCMCRTLTDGQAAALGQGGFDGMLRKPFAARQAVACIAEAANVLC
jgi:excisionase family DNA binding protein